MRCTHHRIAISTESLSPVRQSLISILSIIWFNRISPQSLHEQFKCMKKKKEFFVPSSVLFYTQIRPTVFFLSMMQAIITQKKATPVFSIKLWFLQYFASLLTINRVSKFIANIMNWVEKGIHVFYTQNDHHRQIIRFKCPQNEYRQIFCSFVCLNAYLSIVRSGWPKLTSTFSCCHSLERGAWSNTSHSIDYRYNTCRVEYYYRKRDMRAFLHLKWWMIMMIALGMPGTSSQQQQQQQFRCL